MTMGTGVDQPHAGVAVRRVFGEPYERPDGDLVIPVVTVSGRGGGTVAPLGVFVVHDGRASWEPVVDENLTALLSRLVWLVPATLVALTMLRRPPWPDLRLNLTAVRLPKAVSRRWETAPEEK
jgi:uncharacterized spore protein YtfJ